MLSIQTNVNSMQAQENLRMTNLFQGRTIARLTSGYRINDSGDDAAGLAVANVYRSDVAELVQGVRNANDGLSTLQIIDGGLANISKMLDRLKTLATQSASATFTGDRTTLNKEYQDLLTEIDRQAGMVGLSTGSTGGRNNTNIDVYVGGSKQGTAKVTIELGGSANQVDSAGLNLSGTSIAAGGATVVGTLDIRNKTNLLDNAAATTATQVFKFTVGKDNASPYTIDVTVSGDSDGITTNDVLGQLNAALGSHGIAASLSTEAATAGFLQFSGDVAFGVEVVAAANATGGTELSAAVAGGKGNTGMYMVTADGSFAADANEALTFTVGGQSVSVAAGAGGAATATAWANAINAKTNTLGIYAIVSGTGLTIQSKADFTLTEGAGAGDGAGGVLAAATDAPDATRTATSGVTSAAEAAITAVQTAVSALGLVQGKVGTAQNKLSYAIQLAQSQITSFSAAESRIRDADVAQEAANLTKAQVLQQASLAALAQANSAPQAVLSLLRG
jgi:flagellin